MRFIIFSNARCGTTYVSKAIAQLSKQLEDHTNLNELFRYNGPLDYIYRYNEEFVFKSGYHDTDFESTPQEKIKRNYRFNDILRNSTINFTVKIHMSQFDSNLSLKDSILDIDKLFTDKNTFPILLYRADQLDRFLSKLYAQSMNKYNLLYDDKIPNLKDLNASYDRTRDMDNLILYMKTCKWLRELYSKYDWSLVLRYEDLTGDPLTDFGHMFGKNMRNTTQITKKFANFRDKKNNLINFDTLYKDFKIVSSYYNVQRYMELPRFDMSRVDFTRHKSYLI